MVCLIVGGHGDLSGKMTDGATARHLTLLKRGNGESEVQSRRSIYYLSTTSKTL